ncbi:MAG: glutamine amidotransferase [Gemmatales bacterium]|nr:MAG: glutamine amidotransferase [Gemmatales bacterium]
MAGRLRFLLLQVRNADDPMRQHEVGAFARVLGIETSQIHVLDLLNVAVTKDHLAPTDMVLLGGAGEYSAAGEGAWLEQALDSLRVVHAAKKPTFASCWGFQALARAMGGRVVHDLSRAEVGTHQVYLTEAGQRDPVFAPLAPSFPAQMGHEDYVAELPPQATLLAYSEKVPHQAYRFDDAPIYCTQFHPELTSHDLLLRLRNYPQYVERIARVTLSELTASLQDSASAQAILKRFVAHYFGD